MSVLRTLAGAVNRIKRVSAARTAEEATNAARLAEEGAVLGAVGSDAGRLAEAAVALRKVLTGEHLVVGNGVELSTAAAESFSEAMRVQVRGGRYGMPMSSYRNGNMIELTLPPIVTSGAGVGVQQIRDAVAAALKEARSAGERRVVLPLLQPQGVSEEQAAKTMLDAVNAYRVQGGVEMEVVIAAGSQPGFLALTRIIADSKAAHAAIEAAKVAERVMPPPTTTRGIFSRALLNIRVH